MYSSIPCACLPSHCLLPAACPQVLLTLTLTLTLTLGLATWVALAPASQLLALAVWLGLGLGLALNSWPSPLSSPLSLDAGAWASWQTFPTACPGGYVMLCYGAPPTHPSAP
jgi:hypothetical protein